MAVKPPWKDIPDTNLVPEMVYAVTVKEMTEGKSKPSNTTQAKLMFTLQLKIDEPKAHKGLILWDRFTVGTEDDPEAKDPETWKTSFAARRLKQAVKALKVTLGNDMEDTMDAAQGQQCWVVVNVDPPREDPKTGKKYGESNSIGAYFTVGAEGLKVGQGMKAVTSAPTGQPASPLKGKKPKSDEATEAADATEDGAETPTPDDDEVSVVKGKPKKLDKAALTECPICGEDVPRKEFILHIKVHDEKSAE